MINLPSWHEKFSFMINDNVEHTVCRLKNATAALACSGNGTAPSGACAAGTVPVWGVDMGQTYTPSGPTSTASSATDVPSCEAACVTATVSCTLNNKSHLQKLCTAGQVYGYTICVGHMYAHSKRCTDWRRRYRADNEVDDRCRVQRVCEWLLKHVR